MTVWRRAGGAVAVVLLALAAWAVVAGLQARAELETARSSLEQARDAGEATAVRELLAQAAQSLTAARSDLDAPSLRLAAAVPLLGRPVRAADAITDASTAVVAGARAVLDEIGGTPLVADGRLDVAALRRASSALADSARDSREPVGRLLEQSSGGLPAAVADPLERAQAELSDAPGSFARAAAALDGLVTVLGGDGPVRLLVLLENNAELRGTGGVVTVFAQATAEDGRLDIGAFSDVRDVADEPAQAVPVPAPADYRDLYGRFLANSTLWVNAGMTPDLPTASQVLADVAAASGLPRPDAVLWFDIRAIEAVLRATGPAELPDGTQLTADNAAEQLLVEAYRRAPDTREGQGERRAALRGAADAVLGQVLGGQGSPPSVTALGRELSAAAAGRHVAVWSADPAAQRALVTGGVAGSAATGTDDVQLVTLQNLGGGDGEGNKLDYYARRSITLTARVSRDAAAVEQVVQLRNEAPASGLPRYVAGGVDPGTSNNLVHLALPRDAEDVVLLRGDVAVDTDVVPHLDHAVVSDVVSLPSGASVTWTLRYRLPLAGGDYRLAVVPQPLAVDADVAVRVQPADGLRLRAPAGSPLARGDDGSLALARRPLTRALDLRVDVDEAPWWQRARAAVVRFWREPVPSP